MKDLLASVGLELVLLGVITAIIWLGSSVKKKFLKHLLFNLSAVFIALFLFELYLTISTRPKSEISYSNRYYIDDSELGYGVADSLFSVRATKRWKKSGEEIYDAKYSFENGRRVTPESDLSSKQYSVFLGGSFAFGEGINDTETLPYYYNQLYSQKRNIRNYGFHGYGTHQAYTIAKNHLVMDSALHAAENVEIFYWFIEPHIPRANGYSKWDQNSARYIIENGKLKHTGTFKEEKNTRSLVSKLLSFIWMNSGVFNRIKPRVASREGELELVLRLISEMDKLFKKQGYNFTVLIQNISDHDPLFGKHLADVGKRIEQYLEEQNIQFIYVNEAILKSGRDFDPLYIPEDGHPLGEFNRWLAHLIWQKTIKVTPNNHMN